MARCVPWWVLLVVGIALLLESTFAFFVVRQRDELQEQLDISRAYEHATGDVSDKCQVDLLSCERVKTYPEIEYALDCAERERDGWKEMAENCTAYKLEVKDR